MSNFLHVACAALLVMETRVMALNRKIRSQVPASDGDLVLMHVPFNAGHGTELVGLLSEEARDNIVPMMMAAASKGDVEMDDGQLMPRGMVNMLKKPGGVAWGHFDPDLAVISNVTGCPMYFTPQKYWPQDLAEQYFGNKTIFGIIRNPYDRLVSFFRGNIKGYGGSYPEFQKTCDVNGAVKAMLKSYIEKGEKFAEQCTFIPQAEYFEGPYKIEIPIDFQTFPSSLNTLMEQHHIDNMKTRMQDIPHVQTCPNVWGEDLDTETKQLVQQVYKDDFDLMCKLFGYCDPDEAMCMYEVKGMCPPKAFTWDDEAQEYHRISN